jgi:AcrR family transcriptional regulator
MAEHESIDPRIRRTRRLLHQALAKLLETNEFEQISVQHIADAATLNRATFYDHYQDKFALLQCMVGERFQELLTERGVRFDRGCSSALKAIVLGVCEYLVEMPGMGGEKPRRIEPRVESAVIEVVRAMILDGVKRHATQGNLTPEMIAATASWAIYGAAREWVRTPNRGPSEEIAEAVVMLVSPILAFVTETSS